MSTREDSRKPERILESRNLRDSRPRRDASPPQDHPRRRSRSPSHKRRRLSPSHESPRSRSPGRGDRHESRKHHRSSHRHRHRDRGHASAEVALPFGARALSKGDLPAFRSLFAYFLSLQKQIEMEDLEDREVKGRWKSFVGKWNRGELAEGWYDPEMFSRVSEREPEPPAAYTQPKEETASPRHDTEDSMSGSDDDYGPILPSAGTSGPRAGPGIPSAQDLSMRNELLEEDREDSRNALRAARKADRAVQKERLEEMLPRADAGTRERKLEKRAAVNDKMREFREKSPGGEVNEGQLMGGGDELEEYKREKEREQRKKSEREIRREELERAKREEVEEKRKAWREREEGTVSMLRELARQRFG